MAAGAGGGFVGGASGLAGGGGDDGCGFGGAGRDGGGGGVGGDLFGSHFVVLVCEVVVVKRNGLGLLVVASLVARRSFGRSLATQAPAGFLPKCARVP